MDVFEPPASWSRSRPGPGGVGVGGDGVGDGGDGVGDGAAVSLDVE